MQFIALSLGQLSAFPSNGLMHTLCPLVDVSSAWFKALKSLAAPAICYRISSSPYRERGLIKPRLSQKT